MITSTSLKHPTVQHKIKQATAKALRWAEGTSDDYASVAFCTFGNTDVFIRANNRGQVVRASAYDVRSGKYIGDIKETIANSL